LEWFAIPSPYGSFIRYSLPVLTGAFSVVHFPVNIAGFLAFRLAIL
jgi:hypothetical protein